MKKFENLGRSLSKEEKKMITGGLYPTTECVCTGGDLSWPEVWHIEPIPENGCALGSCPADEAWQDCQFLYGGTAMTCYN